jgi:hypothetical protein
MAEANHPQAFKKCPYCSYAWPTREAFLCDPELTLVGYQVNFKKLTAGLFLFNHACKGTTLAVKALDFQDLYHGPVFTQRLTGSQVCGGHCLHQDDLEPCPECCECSFVRAILQKIRTWPKDVPDEAAFR